MKIFFKILILFFTNILFLTAENYIESQKFIQLENETNLQKIFIYRKTENYIELQPIVTIDKISTYKNNSSSRNIIIITKEEIKKSGIEDIDTLLNNLGCVDIQSREKGVQSDISIRGSNFEETLIMLDGIVLNNPQTGHHNMNIPLTISDIERIEIMPGHSSALYGSYGYSGAINIITKKDFKKSGNIKLSYGSYNTYNLSSSISYPLKNFLITSGIEKKKSDGFIYGREFNIINFDISLFYKLKDEEGLNIYYGITKRDFGAYDFYTPGKNFASKEETENQLIYANFNKKFQKTYLISKVFYNEANDDFILKRENPDFYHNEHFLKKYGAESVLSYEFKKYLILSLLLSAKEEKLESSRLGKHTRENFGAGNEFLVEFEKIGGSISTRIDIYNEDEKYLSWNTGIYYWLIQNFKIRLSTGKSYRMPSFTELYYNDPVNFGNNNLKAGENYNYELGGDLFFKNLSFKNTFFVRNEINFIDWVGETPTGKWFAKNINEKMIFYGFESEIKFLLLSKINVTIRNNFIDIYKGKNYISKYGLNYAKEQLSFYIQTPLFWGIENSLSIVYKYRKNKSFTITSIYFEKNIYKGAGIFLSVENLFNEQYEEILGVLQPPRRIYAGINFNF